MTESDWARMIYGYAKRNALKRGIDFMLGEAYVLELALACGGRCSVTGIPFSFEQSSGSKRPWVPSLDRIESSKGYVRGNVRIVCAAANAAMNEWGESALIRMAKGVLGGFNQTSCDYPPTHQTVRQLAVALKEASAWLEWEGESLGDFHAYAQAFGATPGGNVFDFVLRDALRYRGITPEQFRVGQNLCVPDVSPEALPSEAASA